MRRRGSGPPPPGRGLSLGRGPGAAAAWPRLVHAQEARVAPQVGVLMEFTEADAEGRRRVEAFLSGLKSRTSVVVRWSAADPVQTELLAQELVGTAPRAILASGGAAAAASGRRP